MMKEKNQKRQRLLFYLYLTALMLPQLDLCFTERMIPMGYVMLLMLPLGLYWVYMSQFRNPSKAYLWAFPVLFLGAFQIVLGYLFGKGVIGVDMWLNLATTSPGEAGEMLSQIYPSVIAVVVIYVPTLALAIYEVRKNRKHRVEGPRGLRGRFLNAQFIMGSVVLAVSMVPTVMCLRDSRYHLLDDFFPVNVCYNLKLAVERQQASLHYLETSKDFCFEAVSDDSDTIPEVVVLVIGETSRATNWQLMGYERPTTPRLQAMRDGLVDSSRVGERLLVYPDCMSQSNTTHKSVPILLTMATAEDYSTLYHAKGILAAAREAGFQTCFLSNEPRNHSFNDHLGEQAEEVLFMRDSLEGDPMDTLLIPVMRDMVRRNTGRLLMVVHSYGSHSTYSDRYTSEQAVFSPDKVVKASRDNRDVLINAYDNTIVLTDKLLAAFIDVLAETGRPCVMMYTSDHGEDIYDDDRHLYLHASPYPSYYQLHVPLLCWMNEGYRTLYPDRYALMEQRQGDALQTDCVYPTLLGLAGIRTPYGQSWLSLCSHEYKEKEVRTYLTDHNEAVTLNEYLESEDFEVMKKKNIRY